MIDTDTIVLTVESVFLVGVGPSSPRLPQTIIWRLSKKSNLCWKVRWQSTANHTGLETALLKQSTVYLTALEKALKPVRDDLSLP
jgi:hypothetical protein